MRLQSSVIAVLLIDKEAPGLIFVSMHDIHQAPGLATRSGLQLAKDTGHFVFMARSGDPDNSQNNHAASYFFPLRLSSTCANSGRNAVCSRPGPVETMPI